MEVLEKHKNKQKKKKTTSRLEKPKNAGKKEITINSENDMQATASTEEDIKVVEDIREAIAENVEQSFDLENTSATENNAVKCCSIDKIQNLSIACDTEDATTSPQIPPKIMEEFNAFDKYLLANKEIMNSLKLSEIKLINTENRIPKTRTIQTSKVPQSKTYVKPYTESQLASLYANNELEVVTQFTKQFIEAELKGNGVKRHPLHELLENYLQARQKMTGNLLECTQLRKEYKETQNQIWSLDNSVIHGRGECQDGAIVVATHSYNKATFHRSVFQTIERILNSLQKVVNDAHILYSFLAETFRLKILLYLETLCTNCFKMFCLNQNTPVSLVTRNIPANLMPLLSELRLCISVLFAFQRRVIRDTQFIKETREWLGRLVAIFLRISNWQDHLFILNHILRCPAGVGVWAAHFVQVPLEDRLTESAFSSYQINHVVAIFSVIVNPVQKREQFLDQLSQSRDNEDDNALWVIVDSEGEEDEDSSCTSLRENDLVQLLNQLPLHNFFKNVLSVETQDGQDYYDDSQVNENRVLRFFAFCTVLLKILESGLKTYDQPRYCQLSKRLCRFIRHIVQYATDQWERFKNIQKLDDVAMVCRLQVEYDAFFLRASKYLYLSQKMGAWQFLAVVPYHILSIQTLWKIFYLLHNEDIYIETILDPEDSIDFSSKIWSDSLRSQFEDKLVLLDDAELYYLMSTFANMVLAREEVDMEFIKIGTADLLQIGFISEATQESCSKNARILLTHITSKYPFIISDIIVNIKKYFSTVGSLSLYLFEELPLTIWKPSKSDMEIIASWLTSNSITSDESRLARMILSRLNWGLDEGTLFLQYSMHFKVALLLADVVEQEPGYLQWAWQTAFRLRLHYTDRGFSDLTRISDVDNLNSISKGVREQKPFFCFLALMMTSLGHLIPMICTKGLSLIEILQTNQKHDAVLFALNLIVPLFLNCQESLINCEKYQNILVSLLNADRTYVNIAKSFVLSQNTIVERFGNMIENQIGNCEWYSLDSPRCLIRLWMNSLVSIPNWNKDHNVLQILDVIIKSAFFHVEAIDVAVNILKELLQSATPQESNTSISSLFKWASQSTSAQGSLLVASSLPSCVWLAYILIALEHEEREKQTGLWREILTQLKNQKGKVSVDTAIKKAASLVKVPSFTSSSLCVYRWAQQALDTTLSHPLLPLLWQKFFTLYLVRVPADTTANKGCLGEKFFDGIVNLGFLKRLKKRLQESIDYYQKKTDGCDNEYENLKKEYYENCRRLFRAYILWLEEPRLQESNLHLPSLPPQYEARLLALIVQDNTAPWLEYIDYELVKLEQQKSVRSWKLSIYREKTNVNQPLLNVGSTTESKDPVERILRRLKSYDTPREPPPLIKPAPILPPVSVDEENSIIKTVQEQFQILQQFAHNHILRVSEHKTLDSTYKELVPQLYRAVFQKVKKKIPCNGSSSNACAGPATITLEMQEARINERVDHQIQSNRNVYELTLNKTLQDPSQSLCMASVTVEFLIEILQSKVQSNPCTADIGVELFYYILSLTNEELNSYSPTKNCVMACLEKLGQSFICGVEFETPRLLNKILEEPNLVSLLAPHFSPKNTGTANFLHMYSTISKDIGQRFDIIFPLLSKFDISYWLVSKQPKISQRSQFIELIVKGLSTLNFTPTSESIMLHEVFRKHLLLIFEYQFPEHYGDVLTSLLKASYGGSESGCIAISVWMDIFNFLSHPIKLKTTGSVREQLRQYAQHQEMLSYQELLETSSLLSAHFLKERLQYGLYGLYPKYRNYVEIFALLMGMTGHALIISALNVHQGVLGDKLCEIIWPYIRDMYAPWVLPYWMNTVKENMSSWIQQLTDDRAVLLPWIPADGPFAQKMMYSMFECVQFIINTLPACNNVLSYVWHWYVTNFAHPTVKDYVLNVVHASFLALQWHNFWPSIGDLEMMLKVVEQYLPECHVFLGHIFIQVSWTNWVKQVLDNASSQIILRVHQSLLYLIVKLSNEPNIRSNHSDKTKTLLVEAENFNWNVIEPLMYQHIMDWYVMSCDALVVFISDPTDLDFRVLHFLKVVAHYHESSETNSTNEFLKQHIYIRTYVKLLSVLSSRHKSVALSKSEQLNSVINTNLRHLETVIKDEESLSVVLEDIFGILNIDVINKEAVNCFDIWLSCKSANNAIVKATLRTLPASVTNSDTVSLLLETVVHSYFLNADSTELTDAWKELANALKIFPPKQIELEQSLVLKGRILALNVLLHQKILVCADPNYLLNVILKWIEDLKVDVNIEDKLPLLWSQFLKVALIYSNINMESAALILYKFSQLLLQIGSEKSISNWGKGLLGAIGIVKQESVSLKFRFLSRALAGYVLAQLPETKGQSKLVRIIANAPGTVGQPGGNTDCVKVLLGLAMGQTQGEIKSCAEIALKHIQDPNNSLHNSRQFLTLITNQLYLKQYLKDL